MVQETILLNLCLKTKAVITELELVIREKKHRQRWMNLTFWAK